VLARLDLDWVEGPLRIGLKAVVPVTQEVEFLVESLKELTCSQRMPWGRGDGVIYVNDVQFEAAWVDGGEKSSRLVLELASGDTVSVLAGKITRIDTPRTKAEADARAVE
jgi:hypothetical protein